VVRFAQPPYGTLDASERAPSTASKADMCGALGDVRYVPKADIACGSLSACVDILLV